MTAGYRAVDPASLPARPGNDRVGAFLAPGSTPAGPDEPYAIDGFVLRTHPDLCERLVALAEDVAGAAGTGLYGIACLADSDGSVRAIARGTSTLYLRLPADARATVLAEDAVEAPELGPDWVRLDAWQTVRPLAVGTERLHGLVAAAFGADASADTDA